MGDAASFNGEILRYLNRLSDLCWLLARYSEHLRDEARSTGEKG
jgi:cob(I)alamin adenosyltransferase